MSNNQRDFYRVQDRLLMAWRFIKDEAITESEAVLRTVNRELEEELLQLHDESPETARVLSLIHI